jgi:predicted AAA+ superfamily ATPase
MKTIFETCEPREEVLRGDLHEQTVAFLMSLLKFASESKRTVLVDTLADSSDAFGKESDDLRQVLAEARSVSARQEHVLTPTAEDEVSAIVTHRMFASVDRKAALEMAKTWSAYAARMIEQGVDLPQRAVRSEYQAEMVQDHPFHPELLTTLNRKTSTIPNFQKTRGVLRLLAQTIRELWQSKPKDCFLICPHHLNLGDEQIANDLTSRLDRPQYKQVIEADIASPKKGTLSHAREVDLEWVQAGRPPYAQRVATTAFLHSLVQTGQSGVDPADLSRWAKRPSSTRGSQSPSATGTCTILPRMPRGRTATSPIKRFKPKNRAKCSKIKPRSYSRRSRVSKRC